jgi:hypothetical protein
VTDSLRYFLYLLPNRADSMSAVMRILLEDGDDAPIAARSRSSDIGGEPCQPGLPQRFSDRRCNFRRRHRRDSHL